MDWSRGPIERFPVTSASTRTSTSRRARLLSISIPLLLIVAGSTVASASHAQRAAAVAPERVALPATVTLERAAPSEHPHWVPAPPVAVSALTTAEAPLVQAVPGARRTPATNITMQHGYPSVCLANSAGAACLADGVADLDHARAVMGLPAYVLPADFASLGAAQQLLILSNDDREIYGLPPIRGLNADISAAAMKGVTRSNDAYGIDLPGRPATAWTSNWAAGSADIPYLYFEMMYDDGPGSSNLDCQEGHGCWGHRASVLHDFGAGNQVVMGFASGPSPAYRNAPSIAVLYEGFAGTAVVATS